MKMIGLVIIGVMVFIVYSLCLLLMGVKICEKRMISLEKMEIWTAEPLPETASTFMNEVESYWAALIQGKRVWGIGSYEGIVFEWYAFKDRVQGVRFVVSQPINEYWEQTVRERMNSMSACVWTWGEKDYVQVWMPSSVSLQEFLTALEGVGIRTFITSYRCDSQSRPYTQAHKIIYWLRRRVSLKKLSVKYLCLMGFTPEVEKISLLTLLAAS